MPEIYDRSAGKKNGVLFFDATCRFCTAWIERIRTTVERRSIEIRPFESGAAEPEMQLRWRDGREFGGADAVVFLTRQIWWAMPLWWLSRVPGVKGLLRAGYGWIASNRHCLGGACQIPTASTASKSGRRIGRWLWFLIPALVTAVVLVEWPSQPCLVGDLTLLSPVEALPRWGIMWLLAGSLWLAFKGFVWQSAGGRFADLRAVGFLAWVGMDTAPFQGGIRSGKVTPWPGIAGIVLECLIWGVSSGVEDPVAAGWLGMAGIVCCLHFGLFHLMAVGWNRFGFGVASIMEKPWRARTLGEFWGRRWNRAFSDVARIAVFRPLMKKRGAVAGTLGGFAASGLAHELVISVPAGAGYGLPMIYFLLQGLGVLVGRNLPAGWMARGFTWLVVLGPAFWLFHPPFMERVLVPFFTVMGARN